MIRLLWHIYPITKKIKLVYNNTLEVTWYNGKKLLNTKNTNYSYGSLEKILKFGVSKIDLSQCKNILIFGLGGSSIINTLRKYFNYQQKLTAIEFDIKESKKLKIICIDAIEFLKTNKQKFDFIIIGLFIDNKVPTQFLEEHFWNLISKIKSKYILFNTSFKSKNNAILVKIINLLKKQHFKTSIFNYVEKIPTHY